MLPEALRGRRAESAQAGSGSLQAQTRGDTAGAAGKPLKRPGCHAFLGFPGGSSGKQPACSTGDLGLSPALGRSSGEGKDDPLWYSGLESSMDCIVCGFTKSRAGLNDFHFHTILS